MLLASHRFSNKCASAYPPQNGPSPSLMQAQVFGQSVHPRACGFATRTPRGRATMKSNLPTRTLDISCSPTNDPQRQYRLPGHHTVSYTAPAPATQAVGGLRLQCKLARESACSSVGLSVDWVGGGGRKSRCEGRTTPTAPRDRSAGRAGARDPARQVGFPCSMSDTADDITRWFVRGPASDGNLDKGALK